MAVSVIGGFGRVMIDRMAARLRGQHQRKARIARDVDLVERVHLDSDAKRHWGLLLCVGHVGARRREVTRSRRSRYGAGACRGRTGSQIGRESCRDRVCTDGSISGVARYIKKKTKE